MRQSTRSSRAALTAVGSGSSVNLLSALPVAVGRLPHTPQLSKRAKQRLKWLDDWKTHSVKQTCLHYDLPRSTLHRWQKRFDPGNLSTLEDRSSRPRTMRQRTWELARSRPCSRCARSIRAGARRNSPYCSPGKALPSLSRWSVAFSGICVSAACSSNRNRPARPPRTPCPPARCKPKGVPIPKERPGDLVEIDTMRLFPLPGVVRDHFSAGDVVSRYGIVGVRGVATAGTAKEFLAAVCDRCPFGIKAIQIDGGSEFMAEFETACQARAIPLWVLPPHSPKLNGGCPLGRMERINRTFREEWWEWYDGETGRPLGSMTAMQSSGREGETVSNVIRPHQSLGMRTPVVFLAECFGIHV